MPKRQIVGSIILIILLSFICMYIYANYKTETETTLVVTKTDECKNDINTYYTDQKENDYYLYCIDDISIDFTDRTLELNRALEAKQVDMSFILNSTSKKYSLDNENIVFYQNDDFSLLQCQREDGKVNYIFGKSDMNYKEGLCANPPYICSFNKIYYVVDINESKNNNFIYLTLKSNTTKEVATIKLNETYKDKVQAGIYYSFTFGSQTEKIDKNISDVFANNFILGIKEIDTSIELVDDSLCR